LLITPKCFVDEKNYCIGGGVAKAEYVNLIGENNFGDVEDDDDYEKL